MNKIDAIKDIKDVTAEEAKAIVLRTLGKNGVMPCLGMDYKKLSEHLSAASRKYFMHLAGTFGKTPEQTIKKLKEADTAIQRVLKKLGVFGDLDMETERALQFSNPVYLSLETAAIHIDPKYDSVLNAFRPLVIEKYRALCDLKKYTEYALLSKQRLKDAPKIKKPKATTGFKRPDYTPNEWLLGLELPHIYFTFFLKEFGISKPPMGGKPHGPGIRFIQASVKAMNIPLSTDGHAIEKAYRRAQKKKGDNSL